MKMAKDSVERLLAEDPQITSPGHAELRKLLDRYLDKGQLI